MRLKHKQRGFIGGLVKAVAGPIIGGLFGSKGAEDTNTARALAAQQTQDFNAAQAGLNRNFQTVANAKAMAFSAEQALKNRRFQQRMSNTAHQREIRDLRKAGLNPILSAKYGGSSTPPGASASGVSSSGSTASGVTPQLENEVQAGINSSRAIIELQNAARLQSAQIDFDKQRTETEKQRTRNEQVMEEEIRARISDLQATTGLNRTKERTEQERGDNVQADTRLKRGQRGLTDAQREKASAETGIVREEIKRAINEGRINESDAGMVMAWIDRITKSLGNITGINRRR